ncbi:MAG: patatin-like phospholipase family protein [Myxococcales bacterium]|nr:patatin-like phospholipase family protein [Myxococcales bacterium]
MLTGVVALILGAPSLIDATSGERPVRSTAYVVSGGVSLGSYQAGFLYLVGEAYRHDGRPWQVPLVTGASAGSANGFISALAACLPPEPDPTRSLGWRTWVPVGFEELFDEARVESDALFHRGALLGATEVIWSELARGIPAECDFVQGITATRVYPLEVELQGGLRIPRQEEKFSFRIRGRGEGRPPWFSNYVDPYSEVEVPLLPFEEDDALDWDAARRNFERFRTVLFASMAFPLAFAPQPIAHCLTIPPDRSSFIPSLDVSCPEPARTDAFVDGGVLDNAPLRLAHLLATSGLRSDRRLRPVWRDLSVSAWTDRRRRHEGMEYVYVDPSLTAYPMTEPLEARPRRDDALDLVATLFSNFVYVARSKELYMLLEDRSQVVPAVRLSHRHQPTAGDPLYAFMGFFEQDFRRFDFYLGLFDAYRFLQTTAPDVRLPFGLEDLEVSEIPESWRPFTCALSWLEEGKARYRPTCDGDGLRNFRILLQVSIDRLWDQCARFEPSERCAPRPEPHVSRGGPRGRASERPRARAAPAAWSPREGRMALRVHRVAHEQVRLSLRGPRSGSQTGVAGPGRDPRPPRACDVGHGVEAALRLQRHADRSRRSLAGQSAQVRDAAAVVGDPRGQHARRRSPMVTDPGLAQLVPAERRHPAS